MAKAPTVLDRPDQFRPVCYTWRQDVRAGRERRGQAPERIQNSITAYQRNMKTNEQNDGGPAHTPGPWRVMAGQSVFHVKAAATYLAKTNSDSLEDEANARLISAAPELLSALERIVDGAQVGLGPDGNVYVQLNVIKSVAIAAIARATKSATQPAEEAKES